MSQKAAVRFCILATGAQYWAFASSLVHSLRQCTFPWEALVYTDLTASIDHAVMRPAPPGLGGFAKLGVMADQLAIVPGPELLVMIDADMELVAPLNLDDLDPGPAGLFAVRHFLFPRHGPNQPSPRCLAFVPEGQRPPVYWQTCLFGGRPTCFKELTLAVSRRIAACNHPEGAWEEPYVNWYFARLWAHGRPPRTLGCEFASPIQWPHWAPHFRASYDAEVNGQLPRILHHNWHHGRL